MAPTGPITESNAMNFEEHAAKPLLAAAGIAVPESALATTPADAALVAEKIGPCVVKAQVPTGKRGKAGGIKLAGTPAEAEAAAQKIIGMDIAGNTVEQVLVEAQADIAAEYYACVMTDAASKGPLMLFSTEGGMDIEEVAKNSPNKIVTTKVDFNDQLSDNDCNKIISVFSLNKKAQIQANKLIKLIYETFIKTDANLIEVNPLILTKSGKILCLDAKMSFDDNALYRHPEIENLRDLSEENDSEIEANKSDLSYIKLNGSIGCMVNGAGLAMATMDIIK